MTGSNGWQAWQIEKASKYGSEVRVRIRMRMKIGIRIRIRIKIMILT